MNTQRIGKRDFLLFTGQISNDSYSATIKKLTLIQREFFIQLLPLALVAGKLHVEAALEQGFSSIENRTSFSNSPSLEFLLRFFAQRQISRALEKSVFAKEPLLLVCEKKSAAKIRKAMRELDFQEKKMPLHGNEKQIREAFDISETEIAALGEKKNSLELLVVEKIALLNLEK